MNEKTKEIKRLLELMKTADWSEFKGYIGKIEQMLNNVEKPKRKPLSDDSLPLTKEELEEFSKITGLGIILVELIAGSIYISYRTETGEEENGYVTDVKAILWLADRFELVEK